MSYSVVITNTGEAGAYLENIIDTLPANMLLNSFSGVYGGSAAVPVP